MSVSPFLSFFLKTSSVLSFRSLSLGQQTYSTEMVFDFFFFVLKLNHLSYHVLRCFRVHVYFEHQIPE